MLNDTPLLAVHLGEDEPPDISQNVFDLDEPQQNEENSNDTFIQRSTTSTCTQDECDSKMISIYPPNLIQSNPQIISLLSFMQLYPWII